MSFPALKLLFHLSEFLSALNVQVLSGLYRGWSIYKFQNNNLATQLIRLHSKREKEKLQLQLVVCSCMFLTVLGTGYLTSMELLFSAAVIITVIVIDFAILVLMLERTEVASLLCATLVK